MHKKLGVLLICYGLFLIGAGVIGFILTHETSTSSLFNGGLFGSLVIILGLLHRQGRMWTYPASLSATSIFLLTFTWRSAIQWYAIANGDATKVSIAVLLSIMCVVSFAVALILFKNYRH